MPHMLLIVEPIGQREEALEGSRRFPNPTLHGTTCDIDVRPLLEAEDFAAHTN